MKAGARMRLPWMLYRLEENRAFRPVGKAGHDGEQWQMVGQGREKARPRFVQTWISGARDNVQMMHSAVAFSSTTFISFMVSQLLPPHSVFISRKIIFLHESCMYTR